MTKKVHFDKIDVIYYIKSLKKENEVNCEDLETLFIYYNAKDFKGHWSYILENIYRELDMYKKYEMKIAKESINNISFSGYR